MQQIFEDEDGDLWTIGPNGEYVPANVPRQTGPSSITLGTPRANLRDEQRKDAADAAIAEARASVAPDLARAELAKAQADAAKASAPPTAADGKERARLGNINALIGQINKAQEQYDRQLKGSGFLGLGGLMEYLPTNENKRFDTIGSTIGDMGNAVFKVPGSGAQSDADAARFVEANQPSSWDRDSQIEEKLAALRSRVDATLQEMGAPPAQWTGVDRQQAIPGAVPGDAPPSGMGGPTVLPRAKGATADTGVDVAGATSESGYRVEPRLAHVPGAVAQMVREGKTASQIVRYMNEQYAPFGASAGPELAAAVGGVVSKHRADPRAPIRSLIQGWDVLATVPSGPSSLLGKAADNPVGNAAMHAANAATAGLPTYLAGDQGEAVMAASRSARPGSSFAGDVAGSLAAMTAINRAAGTLGKFGKPFLAGGGIGGDVAYGVTRGAVENGPEGALTGGVSALGGGLVGRYVGAPAVRAIAETAPGRVAVDGIRRASNAVGNAGRGMMGRNPVPFKPFDPPMLTAGESIAARNLPDDATARLQQAADMGLPFSLADTGDKLRALAGSVSRKSPDARAMAQQVMEPRMAGQADRAREQIAQSFGPIANPNEISDQLIRRARQQSGPLYDAFRATPAKESEAIAELLATPAGKSALTNARTIAANEGRQPEKLGFETDALGNVSLTRTPTPETLDLVKRGLDDVLSPYRNPVSGRLDLDAQGRAVEGVRKRFVQEVDSLYPEYAQARAAYAGPAAEREALARGRSMRNELARDIAPVMRDMTPTQADQFRLGQRVAMADTVDKARLSSDPYTAVYGSPAARERAAAVFGPEAADRFQRVYDMEKAMSQTARETIGGSPTATRLAADEQFDGMAADALDTGFTALTGGGAPQVGQKLVRYIIDAKRLGAGKSKADALAPILFETNPRAALKKLDEISRKSARRNNYIKRTRKTGGLIGSAVGQGIGTSLVVE